MRRSRHAVPGLAAAAGLALLGACAVSTQQELQLGAQEAAQVNEQLPIVHDARLDDYLTGLGNRLAAQGTRRGIPWHFYIVNTDVVNAMSLPGGYVYVDRGVIEQAGSASELAGVLAHEIGHVEERHAVRQLERQQGTGVGLALAYVLLGRQPSAVEQTGIQLAGSAVFARYDRAMESQADSVAVRLTARAGYDPEGLVRFFRKLERLRQTSPGAIQQWFATHPTEERRIRDAQALIDRTVSPARRARLTTNTRAFDSFQARMARYPAPSRSSGTR